jgi:hypothetical protein
MFVSYSHLNMKKSFFGIILCLLILISSSFDVPKGWFIAGATPSDYEMGIDPGSGQGGGNAATIKSKKDKAKSWATLMQDFNPGKYLAKRIKMTAYMKTKDVKTKAAFWLRVDQQGSRSAMSFDNMMNRPIKGTTDWTKYEIVLAVPPKASNIAYGALLGGPGQIWFDNFSFEVVDDATPTTNLTKDRDSQQAEPFNVDFEK